MYEEQEIANSFSKEEYRKLKDACTAIVSRYSTPKSISFADRDATALCIALSRAIKLQGYIVESVISGLNELLRENRAKEPTVAEMLDKAKFKASRQKRKPSDDPDKSCWACDDTGFISATENVSGNRFSFRCCHCHFGSELSAQIPVWSYAEHGTSYAPLFHREERAPKEEDKTKALIIDF